MIPTHEQYGLLVLQAIAIYALIIIMIKNM